MDLLNVLLDIFAPIFTLLAFHFSFHLYLFYKRIINTWRSVFRESLAGKVVLIAGASSGMGEHIAYEYGKRGAFLVIGARRENALREVAEKAHLLGSPLAVPVPTDISKIEGCRRLIEHAVDKFGRLDHLVLAAGVTPVSLLEEIPDVTVTAPAMDINFWGFAYLATIAAPYLRRTRGRIVVIASSASWLNAPRLSFYSASKAAVVSFFETLRVEFGSEIGITIVTPGLIESEMTKGKFLDEEGKTVVDQHLRDVLMSCVPVEAAHRCAKTIVEGAQRGDEYLTVPSWVKTTFFVKKLLPEAVDWFNRWFCNE